MVRKLAVTALSLLVALGLASPSLAFGLAGQGRALKDRIDGLRVTAGTRSVAPFAHVVFCVRNPNECQSNAGIDNAVMSSENQRKLESINRQVNAEIAPYTPPGMETWVVGPKRGNCHDYAVTKRHRLIAAGWPPASLRLAVVYTASGEGHLVLVVRTDKGDLVLDNLTNQIRPWNRTGLRFVLIDSGKNPKVWYKL